MYLVLPLTRGHPCCKATYLVKKGRPFKRGFIVFYCIKREVPEYYPRIVQVDPGTFDIYYRQYIAKP